MFHCNVLRRINYERKNCRRPTSIALREAHREGWKSKVKIYSTHNVTAFTSCSDRPQFIFFLYIHLAQQMMKICGLSRGTRRKHWMKKSDRPAVNLKNRYCLIRHRAMKVKSEKTVCWEIIYWARTEHLHLLQPQNSDSPHTPSQHSETSRILILFRVTIMAVVVDTVD